MGRKKDLAQVDEISKKYRMGEEDRFEFGDFLEECKANGEGGTKNDREDFTWDELDRKAKEFLGFETDL